FNTAADEDALRGASCALHLLHTFPSRAMLADALAQYLAAQQWRRVLVLHGESSADAHWHSAFARAARRFGLKVTSTQSFRLTADPRQRELANVRLLTGRDRDHDVVAVLDSDGEFARGVPFATQLPRPVVGAAGLVALAWHPQWERHGGPQLARRFAKLARRPMRGQDWAAWMAVRAIAQSLVEQPNSTLAQQRQALRSGAMSLDGFKGRALSFRPWDGQLRQPVFLGTSEGVTAVAPVEGVLHPTEVLDTLGVDAAESTCQRR
ncbi:MAG: branched-chain amino acid ABC transporter substrate-binding protein, partial [Casimicrobiaceae bacterium]